MAAFPRTHLPHRATWPIKPAPLISTTETLKREFRQTSAVGVMWQEEWNILDDSTTTVRAFLAEVSRLWTAGESFTITPYYWSSLAGANGAGGTLATGTTGDVDGAAQTGASLDIDTMSDGTILEGDYVTVVGVPYSLWLTADATVSGGSATLAIDPPIASGDAPADNAEVTVNGALTCRIIEPPRMPISVPALSLYGGLTITFGEAV